MKQVYQPAAAGTPDPFLLAAIDFDQSADNWGAGGLPTRPPAFEFLCCSPTDGIRAADRTKLIDGMSEAGAIRPQPR